MINASSFTWLSLDIRQRENGQWMKKQLHRIEAVVAELTDMRQHQASCANWRNAFCMQLKITQMLIIRKKKKGLVQVKAFEGICSKNAKSFQNPSLLGNPTCDWVQACLQWGEFWLHGIIHREMQIIWTLWRVKHKLLFLKAQSVRFRESLHLAGMNWR